MSKAIDRIGDKMRMEYPTIHLTTLQELQQHRIAHKETLSFVFNKVSHYARKVNTAAIVTYRLKRFESIISKMNRFRTLNLSGMWDIAGCRCIVNNNRSVYKLLEILTIDKELRIKPHFNDYIKNPKDDGYRSLHLYIGTNDSKLIVEVQIRNSDDHNWATLVEITDLLFKTKLKEYGENSNKELAHFHLLLSRKDGLCLKDKREIADVMSKYNYFERLCEVFSRNNLPVRNQWLEAKAGSFFLIATNENGVTTLKSFPNFNQAEQAYFDAYREMHNSNIVLTHLPRPSYEQLSVAYSNYILTYHTFLGDSYRMLEELIIDSLLNRRYFLFRKYFELYYNIVYNHMVNLFKELGELSGRAKDLKKLGGREREWQGHIQKELVKRQQLASKFGNEINRHIPRGLFWSFVYRITRKRIYNKYNKKYHSLRNPK
jgi:putative GTP pyrophosphokinase